MKRISPMRIVALALLILVLSGCASLLQQGPITQPASAVVENVIATVDTAAVDAVEAIATAAPPPAETAVIERSQTIPTDPLDVVFAQQQAFIDVYERANPAVVNINIGNGQGSGFVYSDDGYIVTNNHVVAGASRIVVTFADGRQLDAELIGRDPDSDLAVIKVNANGVDLTPVLMADSDALRVGQFVIAIGNPFGLENSMTSGIVSGLGRLLPSAQAPNGASYNIPDIIQTDAAINPGNSGGPLLDLFGSVVGVNSAIESPVRSSSGVGYAIPANIVSKVVPQLIETGRVAHPWLGISGGSLSADMAETLGLDPNQRGVIISSVTPDGPAAKAGLVGDLNLGGDIIIGIEDEAVEDFDDLLGYVVQQTEVGQKVRLRILRNGGSQDLSLTLEARPTS